jgi:hypothetical protein
LREATPLLRLKMSIIAEALKKAQEKRGGSRENVDPSIKTAPPSATTLVPGFSETSNLPADLSMRALDDQPSLSRTKDRKVSPLAISVLFVICAAILLLYTMVSRMPLRMPPATTGLSSAIEIYPDNFQKASEAPFSVTESGKAPILNVPREPIPSRLITRDLPTLSGIMYSSHNPQAIINGVLSSEGETIENFLIVRILPESVVILAEGKKQELKLR